jgi:hypothetical protein
MESDRYWVALFNEGGESAGVQRELARCSQREEAHLKYKEYAEAYPNRLVMLCDRATVLARSDRPPMRRVA